MMTGCCSISCEKKDTCALFYRNIKETCFIEDFSRMGSARMWVDKDYKIRSEENYWCGKLGNYAMFKEIKE